LLKDKLQFIIL